MQVLHGRSLQKLIAHEGVTNVYIVLTNHYSALFLKQHSIRRRLKWLTRYLITVQNVGTPLWLTQREMSRIAISAMKESMWVLELEIWKMLGNLSNTEFYPGIAPEQKCN